MEHLLKFHSHIIQRFIFLAHIKPIPNIVLIEEPTYSLEGYPNWASIFEAIMTLIVLLAVWWGIAYMNNIS